MRLKVLGAVIAGGQSRRFGSDKAEAMFRGKRLIDHVADSLRQQCDGLVICGRHLDGFGCLVDRPRPGLGPLGGLAAALRYARQHGFDGVLTSACDTPLIPQDLALHLVGPESSIVVGQPLFGYWPASLSVDLDDFTACSQSLAMREWAVWAGARRIRLEVPVHNINTPGDFEALQSLEYGEASP